MNYRKAFHLSQILFCAGLGWLILMRIFAGTISGWFHDENSAWLTVMLAVPPVLVIISFIIRLCFYNCPHCGQSLRMIRMIPDCCPHCGKNLK